MQRFTGMSHKHKISLSLSVAITLFFVLPWISMFGEAQVLQVFVPKGEGGRRLLFLTISVFLSSLLFFYYNFFWKNRWLPENTRWPVNFLNGLMNLVLVLFVSIMLARVSARLFDLAPVFHTFYIFRNLGIACVAMLVTYVFEIMEQSKLDRIRLLTLTNEKMEAELAVMKTQLDPHFLFNNLNSLTGLIRENPKEAIRFVNHLSETFRYVLDHRQFTLVPLSEELAFLKSYVYLLNVRFGNGLDVGIAIDDTCLDKRLPQFSLQLLVENAVKHNRVSERKPLRIQVYSQGNAVVVQNILQPKKQATHGYGIGLASLNKHYALLGEETIEVIRTDNEFQVYLPVL